MPLLSKLAFAAVMCSVAAAQAAPIADPDAWAKRFIEAAAANDAPGLTAIINEIASPRLPQDKIAESVKGVIDHFAGKKPAFTEQFEAAKTGTFLVRYRFALSYPEQFLFYGVDLVRSSPYGWELFNIKMSTNLNELMIDPYPFK